MEQAVRDASKGVSGDGKIPAVAHRMNGKEWIMCVRADDFFDMFDKVLIGEI